MSWKGFKKAVARMPATVGKGLGTMTETKDEEFDQYLSAFNELEVVSRPYTAC
jgi:amphiphysin